MTNKILNYLTLILFLIPFTLLIVDNNALFPFITTKAIFFRILVTIGLVFAFWLYLINPNSFPKKNYLLIAIALFFLANIIATIFSLNPYRSFWGNAERMEGTWSLFFYLSYFFLLFTLFGFRPQAKKIIFYSILIVTSLISFIEIQQAFFLKLERPSATLGNATYIGFLNLLTIFLLIYFYFETKNLSEKLIYLLLVPLNLASLIASQTRGSILGLFVGILALIFFYFLFSKVELKKKISVFGLIALSLVVFYLFLQTEIALKIPGIKRLSETLQNPVSVFPRLYAWKIFLNGFKEKPLLGWGPETMPIVFLSNFDPRIFLYEKAIFDRPHNKFIEVLTSTGIIGFLSWLLIFVAFSYYLWKSNLSLYQKSSLFAFLLAYLAQNFTLFDMQASYLLFFFGLAFVAPRIEIKESKERFVRPYLILISGLALIVIIIHFQHFYIVRSIIGYLREADVNTASEGFLRLSEIAGPFLTEEANMTLTYLIEKAKENKVTLGSLLNIYQVVQTAYEKDKNDYKLSNSYTGVLQFMIEVKKHFGQNPQKEIQEMKNVFERLIVLYPNKYEIYFNYAVLLNNLGEQDKALKVLEKGEKIGQIYPKYYLEEAGILLRWAKKELAYQKLKNFISQNGQLKIDNEFQTALIIYLDNQDVENSKKIISLWLKQNNSSSTKQIINQILEEFQVKEIKKLDI